MDWKLLASGMFCGLLLSLGLTLNNAGISSIGVVGFIFIFEWAVIDQHEFMTEHIDERFNLIEKRIGQIERRLKK